MLDALFSESLPESFIWQLVKSYKQKVYAFMQMWERK